jgi:hypothetical protein
MDQQIDYKKAWQIPYEMGQRLGSFTMARLARLTFREVAQKTHFVRPPVRRVRHKPELCATLTLA